MIKFSSIICAGIAGVLLFAADVRDGEFSKVNNGALAAWRNTNNAEFTVENKVLSVKAVNGKYEDSIYQGQVVEPSDKCYVFSADVDAPVGKCAYVQIKLFKDKKEVLRKDSPVASAGKSRLTVSVSHPEADYIEYAMRIRKSGAGKQFKFSNPVLRLGDSTDLTGPWMLGGAGKGFEVKYTGDNSFVMTITEAYKMHASMFVRKSVKAGEKYVFEADYESDASRMAYLEVKFFSKGKELKRKQCYGKEKKGKMAVEIDCGNCDTLSLLCRIPAAQRFVGKKTVFSNIKLKKVN